MKKNQFAVAVLLLAILMVLPVTVSVNTTSGKLPVLNTTLQSDGSPIPPMPPHAVKSGTVLSADGSPIPPMPPHSKVSVAVLTADGAPIPPMPPHNLVDQIAV